jgi:hypothetical protein
MRGREEKVVTGLKEHDLKARKSPGSGTKIYSGQAHDLHMYLRLMEVSTAATAQTGHSGIPSKPHPECGDSLYN